MRSLSSAISSGVTVPSPLCSFIAKANRRFPSDPVHHQTTEATFVVEKKVTDRVSLLVEYVGDYPIHGRDVELSNMGGEYLLTRTQQVDFHLAFGLNRNSLDYIVGIGYSWRFDNLFTASTR